MTTIQELRDRSVKVEVRSVRHNFTEDEMIALREEFTDGAIRLSDEEDAFLAVKKEWKIRLDELKDESKQKRLLLRNRYSDADAEVCLVPNFETGMMEIYETSSRELVEERRLRPDERQMNIIESRQQAS